MLKKMRSFRSGVSIKLENSNNSLQETDKNGKVQFKSIKTIKRKDMDSRS